jgi:ABC-2 type transport system permease protein
MSVALATPRGNAAGLFVSTGQIARRVLLKFIRSPGLVVVGTVQGAMFLLIFRYVFGGAIAVPGINYVDFVVPGFITTGVLFNAMYASAGMAEDMSAGLIARLRSLPIPRSAVLVGRAVADTVIQIWGLAITVGIGFLVGFRLHGGWSAAIAAAALVILFGFVFEWLFVLLGMVAGSAQAAQGFALLVFPFTFVSSAYIPVATMPSWMQGFAENQPVTVMVNAVRCLTEGGPAAALLGHPTSYFVIRSLVWSVVLVAAFAPLAVAKYRRG